MMPKDKSILSERSKVYKNKVIATCLDDLPNSKSACTSDDPNLSLRFTATNFPHQ
jgi:hypothetical protein